MIRYLLFDFDGTLADSKNVAISVINQLAGKYNFRQIVPEELEALRSQPIRKRCRTLGLPLYKLPFMAGALLQAYNQQAGQVALFEGIGEMLLQLKNSGY